MTIPKVFKRFLYNVLVFSTFETELNTSFSINLQPKTVNQLNGISVRRFLNFQRSLNGVENSLTVSGSKMYATTHIAFKIFAHALFMVYENLLLRKCNTS